MGGRLWLTGVWVLSPVSVCTPDTWSEEPDLRESSKCTYIGLLAGQGCWLVGYCSWLSRPRRPSVSPRILTLPGGQREPSGVDNLKFL